MLELTVSHRNLRKRGRPKGTLKRPSQLLFEIWIAIEALCKKHELDTGRPLSVSQAVRVLEKAGGLTWIVGGGYDAIEQAIARESRPPFSDWRRHSLVPRGKNFHLVHDENGRIFVTYQIKHAHSLRTRYTEANRLVRNDLAVQKAWTNIVHDQLGLPRPHVRPVRVERAYRPPLDVCAN